MTAAEFRQLRISAGLSFRKAAEALGVNPMTIQRYESGATANIPSEVADRLRVLAIH